MELDRWEFQVLSDVLVLDLNGVFDGHALEKLSCVRAASDGRSASKGLEHSLFDSTIIFVHFNLEFHDISASRRADEAGTDIHVLLIERADVARVFIVVNDTLVIGEVTHGEASGHEAGVHGGRHDHSGGEGSGSLGADG